jgi:hypothetical protein
MSPVLRFAVRTLGVLAFAPATVLSDAVLPGVTVEAESPALIERVRSTVTDGNGQYRMASPFRAVG